MPETVEQASRAASDSEPRIPKWRLDQELAKKRALKGELEKALALIAEQERYITRLEQRVRRMNG